MKLAELERLKLRKEQVQFMSGTITEKRVETRKPMKAMRKMKMEAKYIRYLHLYLSQKTVRRAPNRAKKAKPITTAYTIDMYIFT